MAEDEQGLDAFLTPQSSEKGETVNLEDEFAKLLNDFITQDSQKNVQTPQQQTNKQTPEVGGLDSFVSDPSPTASVEGLDSFISKPDSNSAPENLDSFIMPEKPKETTADNTAAESLDKLITNITVPAPVEVTAAENDTLKTEEQELSRAISNFQDGIYALADKKNLKVPKTDYTESMLQPNYKPSVGKKIAQYLLACWDVINKCDPEHMKQLPENASDEEYLTFAESLSDTDMQLSIISYVEILINIEICEVKYEQKKEMAIKNRIKKELYEEYMELQERKNLFIQKLKEKKFPIDVDRLINNYFRAAQKDAEGAFNALTKNPAMFSPIEVEKIKPKFFGLIKVTPEDGIKANQKIGEFIKKLKA